MSTIPDLSGVEWVKSSHSNNNGGSCVEWAPTTAATTGTVPVRDSKNPTGRALTFPAAAWTAFVSTIASA
ncbi:DUF397 domain-containing protein [Streptomyces sp. 6N223]|uniref:DUF397 domain-containing protein n=1 Tax=Streptomyces sp. 6N223 TaxID=3457412 RepID=UPI003FD64AD7